ncbi:MAG: hypothetical protein JXR95_07730 [Deltaproteobacteria bacterium]|nr:hypothetical protein [Deltaproteobacteria bacterium]
MVFNKNIFILFLIIFPLEGCSLIVTRTEADQMKTRIERISQMLKKRRLEEKSLGEAILKARRQLNDLKDLREKYRLEQELFISKVRKSLDNLNESLSSLEKKVSSMDLETVSSLKRDIADVSKVLELRAKELIEYEKELKSIVNTAVKMSSEDVQKIIMALAKAKEWKLMHGQIALMTVKFSHHSDFSKALSFAVTELFTNGEYAKVILYSALFLRNFPDDPEKEKILFLQGSSYFKFMNCTLAIAVLNDYLKLYPKGKDVKKALEILDTIKKNRHSKQYCAR